MRFLRNVRAALSFSVFAVAELLRAFRHIGIRAVRPWPPRGDCKGARLPGFTSTGVERGYERPSVEGG